MASLQATAQVTSFYEADACRVVELRQELSAELARSDRPVPYNAFFVAAAARSLKLLPLLGAHISGHEVVVPSDIGIGLAVALDETFGLGGGLVVPVVQKADTKSVIEIELELDDKAQRARSKALRPDDVAGGTFTVSNLGGLPGSRYWRGATPIISGDQSAILAIGRVHAGVIVDDGGAPTVRPILSLSLTHDHRLIDGVVAGKFIEVFVSSFSDRGALMLRPVP
jgi:pyruvate/2-oxoglutarate dehydrogenase complex dihydrolipoamide acyltransferase (E2) component